MEADFRKDLPASRPDRDGKRDKPETDSFLRVKEQRQAGTWVEAVGAGPVSSPSPDPERLHLSQTTLQSPLGLNSFTDKIRN